MTAVLYADAVLPLTDQHLHIQGSRWCVVTSGPPVSALDENELVCEYVIGMCCIVPLENSAAVWH